MRGDVIWVSSGGVARLDHPWPSNGRRDMGRFALDQVLANAAPPEACGPDIPTAPARGPMATFVPREMALSERGGLVSVKTGHRGHGETQHRLAARTADAFDLMTRQANRARSARDADRLVALFTPGQVSVGREYAALTERVSSAGVKCSSTEALGGGSTGGDREAAIFRDIQSLRAMHVRIGDSLCKEVRRIRPSANGGPSRKSIRDRTLVDMVCIGGMDIGQVLRRHGWCPTDASALKALRQSLCAALDRMNGYR